MSKFTGSALFATLLAPAILLAQPSPEKTGDWESLKFMWKKPASADFSGSPIGNGEIGAKITGGVAQDILMLNDKTFWSSDPKFFQDINENEQTSAAKRKAALLKTRQALAEAYTPGISDAQRDAKFLAANEASMDMWGSRAAANYLPVGQAVLIFEDADKFTDYSRELHLDRATVTTRYKIGDVNYTREVFASHPDRTIVMRITNDRNQLFRLHAGLVLPPEMAAAVDQKGKKIANNQVTVDALRKEIVLTGTAPWNKEVNKNLGAWDPARGIRVEARMRVILPPDGKLTPRENGYDIDAKGVLLIYSSATSYVDPFTDPNPEINGRQPGPIVRGILDKAAIKPYADLLAAHQADFRSEFRRLWLEMSGKTLSIKNKADPEDFARHYQFARYIMLCVSRAGTGDRPHNQQGMWNHLWIPMSDCCHYLNENVQKMYGLIEPANISGSGDPLWAWIAELQKNGSRSAREDFGFRGWMAPHNSDIWASTTLKGGRRYLGQSGASVWPAGGLWLTNNLYDHYEFTQDKAFLEKCYPILQGAAEFALDYLIEHEGHLVTSPSTSPEHYFKVAGKDLAVDIGTSSDTEIIRNLFNIIERASSVLGKNDAFVQEVKSANAKLVPYSHYIDPQGHFQEFYNFAWYPVSDPKHRHSSHLLGIYPLHYAGIGPRIDPLAWAAFRKAYEARGGSGQHPDRSSQGVRLGFPREGLDNLPHGVMGRYGSADRFMPVAASIAEAIVQSQNDEIVLLPAIPPEWESGKISGIRARGGYELDLSWCHGKLDSATLRSVSGTLAKVRYGDKTLSVTLKPGESLKLPF